MNLPVVIEAIYISPGHNYFGHHGEASGAHPLTRVDQVECVSGKGLRGDRFFEHKEDYKGQITFFAIEVFHDLCHSLKIHDKPPSVFRRNVLTRGIDLNQLIGQKFEIQAVRFEGICECSPCYWMNEAFGPGAEEALKGRGGLRARILSDGVISSKASP